MEILKQKYEITQKALATLLESLDELQKPLDEKRYKITRDSLIQRFEYCVELFWKYIKTYLQEKMNMTLVSQAPKAIITEALNANIITSQEATTIGKALKDRNLTSHMYREDLADDLVKVAPGYYETMEEVLEKVKP